MEKAELRRMFSAQPDQFYNVQVLRNMGFERRQCPKCKGWFWSMGKETCGDTNCEGAYRFIGGRDLGWDFLQAVEKWEKFFEKHKHKVVEPYPIVAKWRPDLFFVIASIADFQPWVLKGIAEPPANPLVVSQPCLRFNDLDNVGRTGRHLTQFFMGGQHAFNLRDYWMNETLGFGARFLMEELKIPQEELTYKEDVWAGGGNFGPCIEAFAHGLEIVNHVFMQFEDTPDGNYKPMDMRVVDTGWGLERVAWYASAKPNTYEAIFPNVAKLRRDLKLEVDWEGQAKFWREIGLYDVSEGAHMPEWVRKELDRMQPLMGLYTILDHTRALAFALADGAIPSNVGGGYNLRNLLRRSFTINRKHKFGLSVADLIKEHAKYMGKRFKNLRELPDVDDIVKLEEQRYDETRTNGRKLVLNLLETGKLKSKLVELYESHGMDPETVAQLATEKGQKVEVPEDFYIKLKEKGKGGDKETVEVDRHLPETEPLFHKIPVSEEFEALVTWSQGKELVLDQSNFYPTSGGQDHDTGMLTWGKEGKAKVVKVSKEGKAILHRLDKEAPAVGTRVKGRVDVVRRMDLARHHTAVHVVNGAAVKVLGSHIWQAGANKTTERARLDITHYKAVTPAEMREIEKVANQVVLENHKVRKMEMNRTAAEQKFGFRIYQGGAVPGAKLNIIHIPGHDAEACGGTHVDYTGEIGLIKLAGASRIQDGVVRLELIAGMRSLEKMWKLEDTLNDAAVEAKTEPQDLAKAVRKLTIRVKSLTKGGGAGTEGIKLQGKVGDVQWGVVDMPFKLMENSAQRILKDTGNKAVVLVNREGGVVAVSTGEISALKLAQQICAKLGGDAGGNEKLARGGGREPDKAEQVLGKLF
ncbi:MAG TPA: alanine--tRNA ligase [archaeon]|nr:alanine--tRNA ligase [archaeon]